MPEVTATQWGTPQVTELADSVTQIEFRDSIIQVREGLVVAYTDKELKVTLQPAGQGGDAWEVLNAAGKPTGQLWRGVILFDGQQLLIQQAKNAILRLYRLDGAVETQFRTCRVVETPGCRQTMLQNGVGIVEDLAEKTTTVKYEDRTTMRREGGDTLVLNANGEWQQQVSELVETSQPSGNEAIDAFTKFLLHWSDLLEEAEPGVFYMEAPPGLREAPPGHPFRRSAKAKADDFRECRMHDFQDGTLLFEYVGRLVGVPFSAHDVVSINGLMLARFVEYDQPRNLTLLAPSGDKVVLNAVLTMETAFDPQELIYRTNIGFSDGTQRSFPA